jgi:hypothetical protein
MVGRVAEDRPSEGRLGVVGSQVAPSGGEEKAVDGEDGDLDLGFRGRQLGDDPSRAGQGAHQALRPAHGGHLEGIGEELVVHRQLSGFATDDRLGNDPDILDGNRLGSRVAELVEEVVEAPPIQGTGDDDPDSRARHWIEATPGPEPGQIVAKLIQRRLASGGVGLQGGELVLEAGHLGPELIVAGVEIGDEDGELLGRPRRQLATAALALDLGDNEEPQDDPYGGEGELAGTTTHGSQGLALGDGTGWP